MSRGRSLSIRDKFTALFHPATEAIKSGENLFRDVLRCKSRADQTRSALTVLQRYRFLFSLPHTIETNINNVSTHVSLLCAVTMCMCVCVCVTF